MRNIVYWDWNHSNDPLTDLLSMQEEIKNSIGLEFRPATLDDIRDMLCGQPIETIDLLAKFWAGKVVVRNDG